MQSEAIKLARLQARREATAAAFKLLENPVIDIVLAFVVIEALQKFKINNEPLMGQNVGTLLEAALSATPVLVSLANSKGFTALVESGGKSIESAAKLAPLLALV